MTVKYDEIGRLEIRVKAAERHALKLEQDLLASEARVRELEGELRDKRHLLRLAHEDLLNAEAYMRSLDPDEQKPVRVRLGDLPTFDDVLGILEPDTGN